MKKLPYTIICLATGIFIGLSISNINQTQTIQNTSSKPQEATGTEFYDNIIQSINTVEIYDTGDLTALELTNRNGKIIVEKIIGEVTNYKLDGKILNCNNEGYITYKNVDGAKEGDKIITYFIYNPFTNAPDDVLTRLDFIIDDNTI